MNKEEICKDIANRFYLKQVSGYAEYGRLPEIKLWIAKGVKPHRNIYRLIRKEATRAFDEGKRSRNYYYMRPPEHNPKFCEHDACQTAMDIWRGLDGKAIAQNCFDHIGNKSEAIEQAYEAISSLYDWMQETAPEKRLELLRHDRTRAQAWFFVKLWQAFEWPNQEIMTGTLEAYRCII
ncbi:MAG: hypothetical protein OEY01_03480 [Desulfobulbaceae bacterium]|nr:hypothetical protein [Desulfobulbaceae bacterium]